jgi:hypothetical protein
VDLDEILYGGGDIGDDLDSFLFNAVASTIEKWQTFKTSEVGAAFELIGEFG